MKPGNPSTAAHEGSCHSKYTKDSPRRDQVRGWGSAITSGWREIVMAHNCEGNHKRRAASAPESAGVTRAYSCGIAPCEHSLPRGFNHFRPSRTHRLEHSHSHSHQPTLRPHGYEESDDSNLKAVGEVSCWSAAVVGSSDLCPPQAVLGMRRSMKELREQSERLRRGLSHEQLGARSRMRPKRAQPAREHYEASSEGEQDDWTLAARPVRLALRSLSPVYSSACLYHSHFTHPPSLRAIGCAPLAFFLSYDDAHSFP